MATHSSVLTWRINSMGRGAWWATVMGSQRVGHNCATNPFAFLPCDLLLLGLVLYIYLKCSLLSPKVITVFLQRFSFFEFSLQILAIE